MRVLNIVTNHDSMFFTTQVESLRARGIEADVLAVPGHDEADSVTKDSSTGSPESIPGCTIEGVVPTLERGATALRAV